MRIERILIAASGVLAASAAVAKVVGVRTNRAGPQRLALYFLVAGLCVALLPLLVLLAHVGYTMLFPGQKNDPRK
jgi:hypothetical protein